MTGSYNNFFRMFDRTSRRDVTLEASRENSKPRAALKPRKVCSGGKRKKESGLWLVEPCRIMNILEESECVEKVQLAFL